VLSSTYQSTARLLLSTLYEPLPKHLISVLGGQPQLKPPRYGKTSRRGCNRPQNHRRRRRPVP